MMKMFGLAILAVVLLTGCAVSVFDQPVLTVSASATVVQTPTVWYPTYETCCYVWVERQWVWGYHSWHQHRWFGREHNGYNRRSRVPREYDRPRYGQPLPYRTIPSPRPGH